MLNQIAAGEIKRAGMSAVDPLLERGPVHVIARNRARYVILTEEQYADFRETQEMAQVARVLAAEAAIARGEGTLYPTAAAFMAALDAHPDDEDGE